MTDSCLLLVERLAIQWGGSREGKGKSRRMFTISRQRIEFNVPLRSRLMAPPLKYPAQKVFPHTQTSGIAWMVPDCAGSNRERAQLYLFISIFHQAVGIIEIYPTGAQTGQTITFCVIFDIFFTLPAKCRPGEYYPPGCVSRGRRRVISPCRRSGPCGRPRNWWSGQALLPARSRIA